MHVAAWTSNARGESVNTSRPGGRFPLPTSRRSKNLSNQKIEDTIGFFDKTCSKLLFRTTTLSVGGTESISAGAASQDFLYREAADKFGSSLERLASAYEADPAKRRDLSPDIHFQLWRSFQHYDARCSLRTWVYRVAHHVAASQVLRERKIFSKLVSLEELNMLPDRPGYIS